MTMSPQANYIDQPTTTAGEASADFCWYKVLHVQWIPMVINLGFLDCSHYYFFHIVSQLSSQGCVDPIPDPLLLRKSGSTKNRTQYLWICSQD
jgi:hypothetical protein